MKEITLDTFYGSDKNLNDLMHHADVFESFKQIASYRELTLTVDFKNDEIERAQDTVNIVKTSLEQTEANVVFVAIRSIDGANVMLDNYIKDGVSVITTGDKWGMFHEMLAALGYEVETNDHMQVISAKLKEFGTTYLFEKINKR